MIKVRTLPVLPNRVPYNEMLFRGLLDINSNGLQLKTRPWNWRYRGWVLLYNGKRLPAWLPCEGYNIDPETIPQGVLVGVAELVDVRELTPEEKVDLACRFTNEKISKKTRRRAISNCKRSLCLTDATALQEVLEKRIRRFYPSVLPARFGFFFRNVRRFRKPIPFQFNRGRKGGQIRLSKARLALVAQELKWLGIKA